MQDAGFFTYKTLKDFLEESKQNGRKVEFQAMGDEKPTSGTVRDYCDSGMTIEAGKNLIWYPYSSLKLVYLHREKGPGVQFAY